RVAESGNQVSPVLLGIEVEEVMVDLDPVPDELDRIAVLHPVVMDAEGPAALRHRAAGMLGNRDRPMKYIVVDLHVLVVLEGELDRESDFDRIVVDPAALPLPPFHSIKLIGLALLCAYETVVRDLRVGH